VLLDLDSFFLLDKISRKKVIREKMQRQWTVYCIIILCFSYLATWLPFFNKPID